MNLELKHLAPYLPYGLKFSHSGNTNVELKELKYSKANEQWTANGFFFSQIKPKLKPLTDLMKGETHFKKLLPNSEDFTPTDVIEAVKNKEFYDWVQICIEWHFDVFGLIERDRDWETTF